jgi:hypothetical protein
MPDASTEVRSPESKAECFVVMPISDPEGYDHGHFRRIFEDLLRPACERAGYFAVRADDVYEANLIHLDILRRLLESPMVLCDLSSRNPNVLFELGLRQAFDRPVVLIQELGTAPIFDIALLRVTPYRRARVYDEVLEDQSRIAEAIIATKEAASGSQSLNSIVRMLALVRPAGYPAIGADATPAMLQLMRAELERIRGDIRDAVATASAHGSNAVREQMFAEVVQAFADAVDGAHKLERGQPDLSSIESLRNRVFEELIRFHARTGMDPSAISPEFGRAEGKWARLLDRELRKSSDVK